MAEVTVRLHLASAGEMRAGESISAWEGVKTTGRGDAVRVAVQLQRDLGVKREKSLSC